MARPHTTYRRMAVLLSGAVIAACGPGTSPDSVAAGATGTIAAPRPEAGTLFLYPERIPLENGGFFTAERGMMFVPVNRSDPDSDVLAVEVYRFRRSPDADAETPPIFYLHGGPSFEGLEDQLAELGSFEASWRLFLDVSDVVVVSQRGIGPSKPTTIIDQTTDPQPADQPFDEAAAVAAYQEVLGRERSFWEEQGLDLTGFTVVEAAADIEDVRLALGYDRIILWGGSFGSHWGMTFMRAYPDVVERAILRGMEGPDHTYDHPGHFWNVFERVAEEAEQVPALRPHIPEGGLLAGLRRVIERAEAEPFTVRAYGRDVLFDGQSVRRLSRGYSGGLGAWPADVIRLDRGDYRQAAAALLPPFQPRRDFRTASYHMLDCGSGITAQRLAEMEADPALEFLGRMNWGYQAGCPAWDSDLGDDFRQNFETDIPTVIVHGTWDTSTPYENALELVPYFTNSAFVTVRRGPHGAIRAAMSASEVFREAILHFAATGDTAMLPDTVEIPPPDWTVPEGGTGTGGP